MCSSDLEYYADYAVMLADALVLKANGREEEAEAKYKAGQTNIEINGSGDIDIGDYID